MPPTGRDLAQIWGEIHDLNQMIEHKQLELGALMGAGLALSEIRPVLSKVLTHEVEEGLRNRRKGLNNQAERMREELDRYRRARQDKFGTLLSMIAQT